MAGVNLMVCNCFFFGDTLTSSYLDIVRYVVRLGRVGKKTFFPVQAQGFIVTLYGEVNIS